MSDQNVAFIAAPYGFGPSSKAVAISSHLPREVERVFLGDGPSLELARASGEFSDCIRLNFGAAPEEVAGVLSCYGTNVFVNSTRFLGPSTQTPASAVFVDTLAWTRRVRPALLSPGSAYFAQRFFDHAFDPVLESTGVFRATGAIVAKALTETREAMECAAKLPIVHCGGLCSPAMCPGADTAFVGFLREALNEADQPVRVILPRHLRLHFAARAGEHISVIDCSPLNVGGHIAGSPFALTTSGIEFTYESTLLQVPTLFLPPFNATQLLQLRYHSRAFDGCVPFALDQWPGLQSTAHSLDADTAAVQEAGMHGTWAAQFEALGRYLKQALSGSSLDALAALQRRQHQAVTSVGSDGAQTIAAHILNRIGRG